MRGQLRLVADRAFAELWQPLSDHDDCMPGLFGEIYVSLGKHLREPEHEYVQDSDGSVRDISVRVEEKAAQALGDPSVAEALLAALSADDFESEPVAVVAFTEVFEVLSDVASSDLAAAYTGLLRKFVARYSIRYYVDDRCGLWLTFPGLASAVFGELQRMADTRPHLLQELTDFEHALAECVADMRESRIKTVIQKQINVLEALGADHSMVAGTSLGRMCDEVGSWPHPSMADAAKSLYRFACDYPGIRHAGTFAAALRPLDFRDLAGVTMSLVGVAAYLSEGIEAVGEPVLTGKVLSPRSSGQSTAPWLGSGREPAVSIRGATGGSIE